MDNVLVTGHTGFIGSHLIEDLKNNFQITGLSSTKVKELKIKQIKKDISKISINVVPKNLSSIIHLAATTDASFCHNNPKKAFEVNVRGTQRILEIARRKDIKVIFLSTSHVFGYQKKLPIKESQLKNPTSIYSGTKLAGEILCESYAKSYGMNISIARLFSVYGPKSPKHTVTNKIIHQLLTKKIIEIGNTDTKRDFIYVKDAVNAILLILKKSRGFNDYNIGTGKSHSIMQIYKTLTKISKKSVPIKMITSLKRKYDVPETVSNSAKIRKLGWKPYTNIQEGLEMTFNWYRNQRIIQ